MSALAAHTAFILRQHHVGVAENVGGGYGVAVDVAVDVAIAAAEKLTSNVASIDADVGVGADLSQIAATENVAIHVRCLFG